MQKILKKYDPLCDEKLYQEFKIIYDI